MENNNGKGIFYGVIGVATLVVAIIGATFAYFASTANGNTGAAAANSANVSGTLEVAQDGQYVAPDLIPAAPATVLASFAQTGDATSNKGKCRGASAANQECKVVPTDSEQFTSVNLAAATGTKQYTMVLYYENTDTDQTTGGSGKAYTGTVMASTSSGDNKIVGYIAGA